jgi:hypothetical protein
MLELKSKTPGLKHSDIFRKGYERPEKNIKNHTAQFKWNEKHREFNKLYRISIFNLKRQL